MSSVNRGALACLCACVAIAVLTTASVEGGTINVPVDHPTIQAAIDVASNNDEIVVAPNTYNERIDFKGLAIVVRSTAPMNPAVVAATIINGGAAGTVVSFVSGEGPDSVLSGFTITNGLAGGGGILCDHSSPTIEYNVIAGNAAPPPAPSPSPRSGDTGSDPLIRPAGWQDQARGRDAPHDRPAAWPDYAFSYNGGGILCYGSTATIHHNTIIGNAATGSGGGICCLESSVTIQDNAITDNTSEYEAGGIYCADCNPTIRSNLVRDNTALIQCGGIMCVNAGGTIRSNLITGNRSDRGAGMGLVTYDPGWPTVPTLDSNLFVGNTNTAFSGGGVQVQDCSPILRHNTWSGNTAPDGGGGVFCTAAGMGPGPTSPVIENGTFYANGAGVGVGGGIYSYASSPTILNSIIAFSISGGGIAVVSGGSASVSYSDVYGNTGGEYVGMADQTGVNGNISADPLFANVAILDFHLKSTQGRWDPGALVWVSDSVHSPCIDAGDPASAYADEPSPNGGRVNMGAFGNTSQASKGANLPPTAPTTVTIAPTDPATTDDLTASASGATDPDGDPLTYEYEWAKSLDEGGSWEAWGNAGATLAHSLTARNEQWKARARAEADGQTSDWTESAPVTIANSPPVLAWLGQAPFRADGHDPQKGGPGATEFTFRVKVADADDTAPRRMFVRLQRVEDGRRWRTVTTLPLGTVSGSWATGMTCEAKATLPNGAYRHVFYARDRGGTLATGDPAHWHLGPRIVAPPQLWTTNLAGRTDDFVHPSTGTAHSTRFKFSVLYTDGQGTLAYVRRLELQRKDERGEWRDGTPRTMRAWGGKPLTGKYYTWQGRLRAGEYRHRFVFEDNNGAATGADSPTTDATQWQDGPVVSEATSAAVARARGAVLTSLAAVPSGAGMQIVFSLSAPMAVDARILNIAGRPVNTLCRARDCEAGANTLLWNAQSDQGLAAPNGTYLIEVVAKSADGAQARGLGQVRVSR